MELLTINLEKSLIKQNKKLATPYELLLINEYDKLTELVENDALGRVGLNQALKTGKQVKNRVLSKKAQTEKFKAERVFHISQIESTCNKYYLRFLRAKMFNGVVDKELPNKITNFEVAYNVRCTEANTFIMAPKESFKLEEKPKDPLMFYLINDEYYYLIHKWGNDLSLFRRLVSVLSNPWITLLIISFVFTLPLALVGIKFYFVLSTIIFSALALVNFIAHGDDLEEWTRFYDRNYWESEYR